MMNDDSLCLMSHSAHVLIVIHISPATQLLVQAMVDMEKWHFPEILPEKRLQISGNDFQKKEGSPLEILIYPKGESSVSAGLRSAHTPKKNSKLFAK